MFCLPVPGDEFGGKNAVAAGWGQTKLHSAQSNHLMKITLEVLPPKEGDNFIFTKLEKNLNNQYLDPCAGDSGL